MAACSALGGPRPWPSRRLHHLRDRYTGRHLRAVLLLPFQVSVLARPALHHPPTCSTTSYPPRRAVPVSATAPDPQRLRPDPDHRDLARRDRRIDRPRRTSPGPRVFDLMVTGLLLPLGIWLAATRPARNHDSNQSVRRPATSRPRLDRPGHRDRVRQRHLRDRRRSDLVPILIGSGRPAAEVAPAALASTFVTSLGGMLTFTLLSISDGPVAPNWPDWHRAGHRRHRQRLPRARISPSPDILIRRIVASSLWPSPPVLRNGLS